MCIYTYMYLDRQLPAILQVTYFHFQIPGKWKKNQVWKSGVSRVLQHVVSWNSIGTDVGLVSLPLNYVQQTHFFFSSTQRTFFEAQTVSIPASTQQEWARTKTRSRVLVIVMRILTRRDMRLVLPITSSSCWQAVIRGLIEKPTASMSWSILIQVWCKWWSFGYIGNRYGRPAL